MLLAMLYEYKKTLKKLRKAYGKASLIKDPVQRESEKKVISGMISDIEYVIDWIKRGREPGKRRGADRVNVYIMDPKLMDSVQYDLIGREDKEILAADLKRTEDALSTLSDRERDVYILHYAELLSLEEIAQLLQVKKSTIQTTLKRAQCKVRKEIRDHELCAANT